MGSPPLIERFLQRTELGRNDQCWNWLAELKFGYGIFSMGATNRAKAHRWYFEYLNGPVPTGLTLDHLCRNRRCVNPAHLEIVTNRVNILRGTGITAREARVTECAKGHPFDFFNTYRYPNGGRGCRACARIRHRAGRARRREVIADSEYCVDCGFVLPVPYPAKGYVACRPCGGKCCDRWCWASHRKDCDAVVAANAKEAPA